MIFRPCCSVTLFVAAALVASAGAASAQTVIRSDSYHSPQRWALELRGGPYAPDVDAEFTDVPEDERPHAVYFGNKNRTMFGFELDFQVFQGFGSLAVGLGGSYFRERAHSFVESGGGQPATERSGDETSLTLYPTTLSLVYRFDVLAKRRQIPIVPYGKVGLDYVIWIVSDGNGDTSDPAGPPKGSGGTRGWHAAAGVALQLDYIDPGGARELDSEIGVNHTYLFAELAHYDISGLGQSQPMRLGDTTWHVGLMFEF